MRILSTVRIRFFAKSYRSDPASISCKHKIEDCLKKKDIDSDQVERICEVFGSYVVRKKI